MHTYSTNPINTNIKTDPLAEILNNISKNPAVYTNRQAININNKDEQCNEQINNKSLQQEAKAIEQCTKRAYISQKEEIINLPFKEVK